MHEHDCVSYQFRIQGCSTQFPKIYPWVSVTEQGEQQLPLTLTIFPSITFFTLLFLMAWKGWSFIDTDNDCVLFSSNQHSPTYRAETFKWCHDKHSLSVLCMTECTRVRYWGFTSGPSGATTSRLRVRETSSDTVTWYSRPGNILWDTIYSW